MGVGDALSSKAEQEYILAEKERENVKLWASAEKEFEKPLTDYGFALSIIE